MPTESSIAPEETSAMAAHAAAMIDAALVGTDLSRDAYWAAVRKGYNTPYNDPPRRRRPEAVVVAEPVIVADDLCALPRPSVSGPAVEAALAAEILPALAAAHAV